MMAVSESRILSRFARSPAHGAHEFIGRAVPFPVRAQPCRFPAGATDYPRLSRFVRSPARHSARSEAESQNLPGTPAALYSLRLCRMTEEAASRAK